MGADRRRVEAAIAALLAGTFLVPARRIRPEARLARDLGVVGDDAAEFVRALQAQLGPPARPVDWARHIDDEGFPSFRRTQDITLAEIAEIFAARAGETGKATGGDTGDES